MKARIVLDNSPVDDESHSSFLVGQLIQYTGIKSSPRVLTYTSHPYVHAYTP